MQESIVFFGTGPVASESLKLLAQTFTIEAVVTKPRAPHHHGAVPVLDTAAALGLPIIEVVNKKDVSTKVHRAAFKSSLSVLIDFGIIVTQDVIDSFALGIVNSHFSLLPQWRGADPITFSILSGQKTTGVSLMLLVEAMDEGPLLAVGELDVDDNVTTPMLTSQLIELSYSLLSETLPKYVAGEVKSAPQEKVASIVGYSDKPSYSRKLTKEDGVLDWTKPAAQLEHEIRAYIEWPKSRTILGGHAVIITKAHVVPSNASKAKPGDIEIIREAKTIMIATGSGSLCIDSLKPAGKQEMTTSAFLNGYKI